MISRTINDIISLNMVFYKANQYFGWESDSKLFSLGSHVYYGHYWSRPVAIRSSNWKYAKLPTGSWTKVHLSPITVACLNVCTCIDLY